MKKRTVTIAECRERGIVILPVLVAPQPVHFKLRLALPRLYYQPRYNLVEFVSVDYGSMFSMVRGDVEACRFIECCRTVAAGAGIEVARGGFRGTIQLLTVEAVWVAPGATYAYGRAKTIGGAAVRKKKRTFEYFFEHITAPEQIPEEARGVVDHITRLKVLEPLS